MANGTGGGGGTINIGQMIVQMRMGLSQLERDQQKAERALRESARRIERDAKEATKRQERIRKEAQAEIDRMAKRMERDQIATEKRLAREAARAEKDRIRAKREAQAEIDRMTRQMERDQIAAEKRVAAERKRLGQQAQRDIDAMANAMRRDQEKAEREALAAQKRADAERMRNRKKLSAFLLTEQQRSDAAIQTEFDKFNRELVATENRAHKQRQRNHKKLHEFLAREQKRANDARLREQQRSDKEAQAELDRFNRKLLADEKRANAQKLREQQRAEKEGAAQKNRFMREMLKIEERNRKIALAAHQRELRERAAADAAANRATLQQQKQAAAAAERAERNLRIRFNALDSSLRQVAGSIEAQMTAVFQRALFAIAGFVTSAVLVGAGFEKQMTILKVVANASKEELVQLEKEARRIGETTMFSATDAAKAMTELAQAGLKTNQILAMTADAMMLAASNEMNLRDATHVLASTMILFNLPASEAGRVADTLTVASQETLATLEDLSVAFRYAGSTGATFGMTLEETAAATAQFANIGLVAEQQGTRFRIAMERLVGPPREAREALKKLGVELHEVNTMVVGFEGAMRRLAASSMDADDAMKIFGRVAGGEIAKVVQQFRDGTTTYYKLLEAFRKGNGTASRMFQEMASTIWGHLSNVRSAVEETLIVAFDGMRDSLARLFTEITARFKLLNDMMKSSSRKWKGLFDTLVDGIIALIDAIVRFTPYVEEAAAAMLLLLVGSKMIRWTVAILELATLLGFNLVGAVAKLTASLQGASAASVALFGFMSVNAIASIVAAVGQLIRVFTRLTTQLSGAAREARELDGALKGASSHTSENLAAQKEAQAQLLLQQKEIKLRLENKERLTDEQEALLRMDAAQAHHLVQQGELLWVMGELRVASMQDKSVREKRIKQLDEEAEFLDGLVKKLEKVKSEYQTNPLNFAAPLVETGVVGGVLRALGVDPIGDSERNLNLGADLPFGYGSDALIKAREILRSVGIYQVNSLEDISQAHALLAMRAEDARQTSAALTRQLSEERLTIRGMRPPIDEFADGLSAAADAAEKGGDHLKEWWDYDPAGMFEEIMRKHKEWMEQFEQDAELMELANRLLGEISLAEAKLAQDTRDLTEMVAQQSAQWDIWIREANKVATVFAIFPGLDKLYDKIGKLKDQLTGGDGELSLSDGMKQLGNALLFIGEAAVKAGQDLFDFFIGPAVDMLKSQLKELFDIFGMAQNAMERADTFVDDWASKGKPGINKAVAARSFAREEVRERAKEIMASLRNVVRFGPVIIDEIVAQLPVLMDHFTSMFPKILRMFAEHLPDILMGVVSALLINIKRMPRIIDAFLTFETALLRVFRKAAFLVTKVWFENMPRLTKVFIKFIPDIVFIFTSLAPEIGFAIMAGYIAALPEMWENLTKGFKRIATIFGNKVLELLTLGFFHINKDGKAGLKTPRWLRKIGAAVDRAWDGVFGGKGSKNRHFSGINWVPHTMATIVEPGEAILDRDTNRRRMRAGMQFPEPAPFAPGPGGWRAEIVTMLDGRVVDATMADGMAAGRMPRLRRAMRNGTPGRSVRAGVGRGKLNLWGG